VSLQVRRLVLLACRLLPAPISGRGGTSGGRLTVVCGRC